MTESTVPMKASISCDDPDEFRDFLRTVSPCDAKPLRSGSFKAELNMARLPRIGMGVVRTLNCHVTATTQPNISLNFPIRGQFTGRQNARRGSYFSGNCLIAHPGSPLDLRIADPSTILVCNFDKTMLESYALKYNGNDHVPQFGDMCSRFSIETRNGAFFYRYLNFIWSELNQAATFLQSSLATTEIEDSLLALFIASVGDDIDDARDIKPLYLRRAEEYIAAHLTEPLSLADIATSAGISAPTLTRAFRRHHNVGPKAFSRQRRLERVQQELLATSPLETTVAEVAMRYGFYQLSHFAQHYCKAFGELPSETLRRSTGLAKRR